MEIKIDIPDKVYNEISEMCEFNSISVENFAFQCIMDSFNLMKYDDLNKKLNSTKTIVEEKPTSDELKKEKNDATTEKKKVGRPRKKKIDENNVSVKTENVEQTIIRKEETVNTIDNNTNKVRRLLKIK